MLERNTEFDGENLRFFVTLDDGTEASLNTTDNVIQTAPGVTPVPGHQAQAWTFLKITDDATSVAHALVSWDPDDPADYLMAGWWAEFPDQKPPLSLRERSGSRLSTGRRSTMASRRNCRSTGRLIMQVPPGGSTHTRPGATGERMRANS